MIGYAAQLEEARVRVKSAAQSHLDDSDRAEEAWEELFRLIADAVQVAVDHSAGYDLVAESLDSVLSPMGIRVGTSEPL